MTRIQRHGCTCLCLLIGSPLFQKQARAQPVPFWENFPRIIETPDLSTALSYHATVAMNHAHSDPGWGLYGQKIGEKQALSTKFHDAGLKNISYYETFGQSYCYVAELGEKNDAGFTPIKAGFWSWPRYHGGRIIWIGVHNYFDDAQFARPYTRKHARYGAPPVTYPDGTVATGFNGPSTDPRTSRVFDAACSKDILGRLSVELRYNEKVNRIDADTGRPVGPLDGLLRIPETGKYAGLVLFKKDSACPAWIDYAYASALLAADAGSDGMWTDNFSPWDSFGRPPVRHAFGEWSVARFREELSRRFRPEKLRALGVRDVAHFDIRSRLMTTARTWGWDGANLHSPVWKDPRWLEEPLWRAYVIFKRRVGTQALTDYYNSVKAAARKAGKTDFLIAGNDIPGYSLGWPRGDLDMVSTELTADWGIATGPRGLMLPPIGRLAPVYKLAREHARSRFVTIWLYKGLQEKRLTNPHLVSTVYYEMLATHALPMFHPKLAKAAGTPEADRAFFAFVDQVAPEYGGRIPVEDVGVYYSSSSILATVLPGGFLNHAHQPHQFAFWGWATALGERHIQYRAVPEWKLNRATLRELRVLVIPEAEVLDPRDVAQTLLPWVRDDGGLLIVTGSSGRRLGETGNFDRNPAGFSLAPLTGIANLRAAPARTLRPLGKGRVLYLRENLGMKYYLADKQGDRANLLPEFHAVMSRVLDKRDPLCLTPGENVSSTIGLTLYQDEAAGKFFVDVNNLGIDPRTDMIRPTSPLTFSVRLPPWLRKSKNVARVHSPEAPPTVTLIRKSADTIEVALTPVRYYAGVVIDSERSRR